MHQRSVKENRNILPICADAVTHPQSIGSVCNGKLRKPRGRRGDEKIAIGGTMAAVPGVSMQCASPAGEISLSAQHGVPQPQPERPKPEESTGEHDLLFYSTRIRRAG